MAESVPSPSLSPIVSARLGALPALAHGFFTRLGGVSQGIYASLNTGLGSADARTHVLENRRRIAAWLGVPAERLLTPSQAHTNIALPVAAPWGGEPQQGDALVTAERNLAIGIMTADCGAVLLAEPQAGIIGAAHAGWKGALGGILQSAVAEMERLGAKAERIIAVSGPSISAENYEVGEEFRQQFIDKNAAYTRYFTPWAGARHTLAAESGQNPAATWHCDLRRFILDRLAELGAQTEDIPLCTYADAARFFSFRRATHRKEADYGRQISAICLR